MAALGVSEKESIGKGLGLFADVSFDEEDVIFTEKPLVSCQFSWNKAYKYRACDYCLRSLETAGESSRRLAQDETIALPYKKCCTVDKTKHRKCSSCEAEYCSEQCQTKASKEYHDTICAKSSDVKQEDLDALEDTWKQMHFPPETSSIMLIVRMIARVKQSENKDAIIKSFNSFCSKTKNEHEGIVHKLLGDKFKDQIESLRLQLKNTIQEDRLSDWYTADGFRSLLAILGTNQQGIGTSSISTWVKNCYEQNLSNSQQKRLDAIVSSLYIKLISVAGDFMNCDGVGLYSLQSRCNHSCNPNARVAFDHGDHTLTLRAVRPIAKGDEILISYICEDELWSSRHTRQKLLSENYLFLCGCTLCEEQANDPDVTSDEETDSEEGSSDEDPDCDAP